MGFHVFVPELFFFFPSQDEKILRCSHTAQEIPAQETQQIFA